MPACSASALNASANPPVARESISSPRVPTADIIMDTPVSNADLPSGVRLSPPAP